MRHRAKGRQLSRTSSHKKATLNNMATSLFQHEGINTTVAKAKELRPFAERLITLARRGDLHARASSSGASRTRPCRTSCSPSSANASPPDPAAIPES